MQFRVLILSAFAVAGLAFLAPEKSFATTKDGIYAKADTSIMYRRRHGADDGDEDDTPGGAHAGEDDRDQDDGRQGNETHRDAGSVFEPKKPGSPSGSDSRNNPKPELEPIGR